MMRRRTMSRLDGNRLEVAKTVDKMFGDDLHAMRVASIANGVVGVLHAATLSIHAIGRAYAHAVGGTKKHGVKQTDRMLSNDGINVWSLFSNWVAFVVADRKELVVALDWTEFDADDHATLAAHLITTHGRSTPLVWMTVPKATLEGQRNGHEYKLIERLHECVAPDVRITVLADRGFGDQKLYGLLQALGWDFVIRFRGVIQVENEAGETKSASAWLPESGRATMLRDARVTRRRAQVPAVVVVHAAKMKEPWCLATTLADKTASEVVKLYGRRFTIGSRRWRAACVGPLVGVQDDAAVDVARGGRWSGSARSGCAGSPPCRRRGCATRRTSGRSRPSRSRLMPTSTSNSPSAGRAGSPCARGCRCRSAGSARDAELAVVVGQVLGHALGERGDEHALAPRGADRISASRSSTWVRAGRTSTSGRAGRWGG
jgi:hypothetical protein